MTLKIEKHKEKSFFHPGIKLIIFFFIIVVIILLGNYIQKQDEYKLKDSIKTKAVITKIGFRGIRRKESSYIKFKVKNKIIKTAIYGDWTMFEIGDTIEIIYSKVDPTIIRVSDRNYEKKKEIIKKL